MKCLLQGISGRLGERHTVIQETQKRNQNSLNSFEGVLPHPKSGRTSKQSSFVNVTATLKEGVANYDDQNSPACDKIDAKEIEGSLLSWTHNAMASIRSIIGRYHEMNRALGQTSLDDARNSKEYQSKPFKYNRDVSSIIRDIRRVLPIVVVAMWWQKVIERLENFLRILFKIQRLQL